MPRLMADIFPTNLACQAAVHYTTLRHTQADVPHASVCVCVCACLSVKGNWPTLARQGGWNEEEGGKKGGGQL